MNIETQINEDMKQVNLSFNKKNDMISLLKAILRHGSSDLPFNAIPGMSMEQVYATMEVASKQAQIIIKDKPSIIHWLQSGLFEATETFVPLALLLIEWYEQHPLCIESNDPNFREIYHFLYKITMNQPILPLSHGSAKVLHTLISDVMEQVWPNTEQEVFKYLRKAYNYSRPINRRMYPGKRTS